MVNINGSINYWIYIDLIKVRSLNEQLNKEGFLKKKAIG